MTAPPPPTPPQTEPRLLNVWALAGEIGIILAVPLVVLVIAGVKADKYFGTTPLFIIVGMLAAAIISATAITRKVKRLHL